jgi:cold shock CspA family protein
MQTLVITNAGRPGYAFARSLDEPTLTNVFLHSKEAGKGVVLAPGCRVRALIIQTPNGPQARNIQLPV